MTARDDMNALIADLRLTPDEVALLPTTDPVIALDLLGRSDVLAHIAGMAADEAALAWQRAAALAGESAEYRAAEAAAIKADAVATMARARAGVCRFLYR